MTKTLKTILIALGVVVLLGIGYIIGQLPTVPSSVQHTYPLTINVTVAGDFVCVVTPDTLNLKKGEIKSIQITNTVSGGFDAKIMYVVSGLPAGSYSFSVNPVNPGQATTLTINSATLASNTVYVCSIVAGDTNQ